MGGWLWGGHKITARSGSATKDEERTLLLLLAPLKQIYLRNTTILKTFVFIGYDADARKFLSYVIEGNEIL